MDLLESYYGKQTFVLYSLFAKVPGSKAWPRVFFLTLSILVLFLVMVFQVIKLIVAKFEREVVIELLPTTAAAGGTLLYVPYVACATEKQYNVLLSIMMNDLREERTDEEDAIKREYAKSARTFIKTYTILPLNESRGIEFIINGEIFIDQEKYFAEIYLVESCVVVVVGIVIGVSENMGVIMGQHACGMTAVLGKRLRNITRVDEVNLLDERDCTLLITNRLKACISGHQTILQFGLLIADFYNVPLTFILIGTFSALTVSFVQVTDPELINLKIFFFTIAQVFQLFILSYLGQSGTDASEEVSVHALLQLMILRSSKPCLVVVSSMYTLTLANYMSVMQTIVSCYMILRQA